MAETIAAAARKGETWLLELDGSPSATVSLNRNIWPGLWSPDELAEPAFYIHRLIVDRDHAGLGLGAWLTDWCGIVAARKDARWLRADVWTTNTRLQDYYCRIGFDHVRTVVRADYPSGALFQRAVERPRLS
jgi:ribosomal protein S18 acetylase RimI-like enzyme